MTSEYTVAGIRAATAPVLDRLREGAAERERERQYAFEEVKALAAERITLTGIAVADGALAGPCGTSPTSSSPSPAPTPMWRKHCGRAS
nr:hypothetical protein GCM10025732_44450 [Glycomyces mayteni]